MPAATDTLRYVHQDLRAPDMYMYDGSFSDFTNVRGVGFHNTFLCRNMVECSDTFSYYPVYKTGTLASN